MKRDDEKEAARNKARMEGRPTRAFVVGFMRRSGTKKNEQPRDKRGRFKKAKG
jgi:hypothetical protein